MFTLRSHRMRKGPYALAPTEEGPQRTIQTIGVLIAIAVAFFAVRGVLRWFNANNVLQRSAVIMAVEPGGIVSVAIEGGSMKRAEDSLKLYEGDRLETGGGGRARVEFFDGSVGRVDETSTVSIEESTRGTEESVMHLELAMGGLWLRTANATTFSGAVVRTIDTPAFSAKIPSDAEVLIRNRSIAVFAADGLGVEVLPEGADASIFIGEGQAWELPADADVDGDLYVYRSALAADSTTPAFVAQSRAAVAAAAAGPEPVAVQPHTELLTVSLPQNNAVIATATVRVEGRIGVTVVRVRVNGYEAATDREKGTFMQDVALEAQGSFDLHIEAIDGDGIVVAEEQRTVVREAAAMSATPVTITDPAGAGSSYRTQRAEIVIRGTAPKGTEGIMVNDYRLQLFEPSSGTWSYLASVQLGNLKPGTNVYNVIAIDASGNKSPAATLTILMEEGTEGVISTPSSAGTVPAASLPTGQTNAGSASSAVIEDETKLPSNAPLTPGVISVTGPSPSSPFTSGSGEVLLEGTTSAQTDSMWINGYRLRLYLPGKTTWNYIASTQYATLKRGDNTYKVVARNAAGEILDRAEYVIRYEP